MSACNDERLSFVKILLFSFSRELVRCFKLCMMMITSSEVDVPVSVTDMISRLQGNGKDEVKFHF